MAQRMDDVIDLCCEIAGRPEFKKTWKNVGKGMLITGVGAGAGGLLLGPVGLFLGGAAGGGITWLVTRRKFKSVPRLLMKLPHAEKQKLYNDVVAVLDNLTWRDAAHLVSMVMSNAKLQQKVTGVVVNYIKKKV